MAAAAKPIIVLDVEYEGDVNLTGKKSTNDTDYYFTIPDKETYIHDGIYVDNNLKLNNILETPLKTSDTLKTHPYVFAKSSEFTLYRMSDNEYLLEFQTAPMLKAGYVAGGARRNRKNRRSTRKQNRRSRNNRRSRQSRRSNRRN